MQLSNIDIDIWFGDKIGDCALMISRGNPTSCKCEPRPCMYTKVWRRCALIHTATPGCRGSVLIS